MSDEGAPPPPPVDAPSMKSGGIYIRWRDNLWQEQPDGAYLLWEDSTRQWITSTLQPPAEGGQAVATTECPNCGKRVKSRLRSCPYCSHAMPVAPARPRAKPIEPRKAARRTSAPTLSPAALVLAVVLVAAIGVGLFLKTRADSCANWKAGVRSYTQVAAREQGLPRGLSEEELHLVNEQRFADTRPGGCE